MAAVPEDYAVQELIKNDETREVGLGPDPLSAALRGEMRTLVERLIREELVAALGAEPYERTPERRGYQHSPRERTITTGLGPVTLTVPRGRLFADATGVDEEWQSQLLPRYARRTREVDAALAGLYLSGTNTRRVKLALKPLLQGAPLSKSAVSRVVAGLQDQYEAWRLRSLSGDVLKVLYLDAIWLRVRLAKKIEKLPVAVAVGVREDGSKVLLGLWAYANEGRAAWGGVLEDLTARGLPVPALVVIDGGKGLRGAVTACWPKVAVQRCTVHKLRNLEAHAPKRVHEALREDYHDIVYAENEQAAQRAWQKFTSTWKKRCPAVAESLQEAGSELLTFYRFPESQWKGLRTTNIVERVNEEFRRRVKTQAVLPSADSALLLLYGLAASGQLKFRKLDGYQELDRLGAAAA
jgi:putative transposase